MDEFTDLVTLFDELGPALFSEDEVASLTALCDLARLSTVGAACSVSVLDEGIGELRYAAAAGAGADEIVGTRLSSGRGIAGFVAGSGQGISVSDVRRDVRFAQDVAETTGYVPTALMAVPIRSGDETLGVLTVLDPERADLTVAAGFADLAAHVLLRATNTATLGRAVAHALASHTSSVGLADVLRSAAAESSGASADLTELAALYVELGKMSTEDRAAATRIVAQFTAHAADSQQRTVVRRFRR